MKLRHLIYILLIFPFLSACNNEDDVDAIFVSGTWYLQNFYTSGWNNNNIDKNIPKYTDEKDITTLQNYTVRFQTNGTFTVNASGNISGKWSADGKSRAVSITFDGSSNATGLAKEFIDALKNAQYYDGTSGDKGFMRFTQDKKAYIQLSHFAPN